MNKNTKIATDIAQTLNYNGLNVEGEAQFRDGKLKRIKIRLKASDTSQWYMDVSIDELKDFTTFLNEIISFTEGPVNTKIPDRLVEGKIRLLRPEDIG